MPRAERIRKNTAKKLLQVAQEKGQKSISGFFRGSDNNLNAQEERATEDVDDTAEVPKSDSGGPFLQREAKDAATASIASPWIKKVTEFTLNEKKCSENKGRYFQPEWFQIYGWLWYHRDKRAAFCGICTEYKQPHDVSPFVFTDHCTGFRNWKKGKERLEDHSNSDSHKLALKDASKMQATIECQFDDYAKEKQRLRRQGLISHLNTLKTLLRQGIAIRGHTDENSNIYQFNKDKANDNEGLNLLLKENLYLSHEILSEQEEILVLAARKRLINDVLANGFYAIICDESSDISKTEQMSFSIRYCNDAYEVFEEFVGILPCDEGVASEALLKYVRDILTRCCFPPEKMVGMAFDGASAMKKLAVLLKEKVSKHALYIHCFAHCNELVFKDATLLSSMVSDSQDLCEDVYALAGVSPKRVLLFQAVQKEISSVSESTRGILKLKNLSRTRWTTRGAAAEVVIEKNKELQETLRLLSVDASVTPECRAKSKGLIRKLQSFPDMFKLVAMYEFASLLENNSRQLQSASLTAEQATASIDMLYIRLQGLRTDAEFERLHQRANDIIQASTGESGHADQETLGSTEEQLLTKRKRRAPAYRADYFVHTAAPTAQDSSLSGKDELRRSFYETIDALQKAIKRRFDQEDLRLLKSIERCLINAANKQTADLENAIEGLDKLSEVIDVEELKDELQELPVHIKLLNQESHAPVQRITKVSTICEILNEKSTSKECLPQLHQLLKLYTTVPLGSATAERSFSAMRRIKSWLRSTMTANSLNNRMFCTLQKDRTDDVCTSKIAKEFIARNDQRRRYFGTFEGF